MTFAARLRRYVLVVLAVWPVLGGRLLPRAAAQDAGGPADLFVPPRPTPILPGFPPLEPAAPGTTTPGDGNTFVPFNSWASLRPGDRERRKVADQAEVEGLGQLSSEVVFRAPEHTFDTPFERGEWSRQDTLKLPVAGPLALFGQTALTGDYAADQNMTVVGRTGAILKLPTGIGSALELRGGPAIKYNDALRSDRTASLLMEVQAKWPIIAGIGLEYNGAALPAMTPLDRPKFDQDLGLAIPVSGGKLKLGAKHHWEQQFQGTTPGATNMELYVGVEIGR
jgi:hypothetical protein